MLKFLKYSLTSVVKYISLFRTNISVLVIGFMINLVFVKKVSCSPCIQEESFIKTLELVKKNVNIISGAKTTTLDLWQKSDKNFILPTIDMLKLTKNHSFKISGNKIANIINSETHSSLIEKINESEKLRNRLSKINLGELVLSGMNIFKLINYTFSIKNTSQIKKDEEVALKSMEILSIGNPDSQLSNSLFFLMNEVKTFCGLTGTIPFDRIKGMLLAKFGYTSGSSICENVFIENIIQNNFFLNKITESYQSRIKKISIIFRPATKTINKNKIAGFRQLRLNHDIIPTNVIIIKSMLKNFRNSNIENIRKIIIKNNNISDKFRTNLTSFKLMKERLFSRKFLNKKRLSSFFETFNRYKSFYEKSRNIKYPNCLDESNVVKSTFNSSKINKPILFNQFLSGYESLKLDEWKIFNYVNMFNMTSFSNFSKRFIKVVKEKENFNEKGLSSIQKKNKIDIRINNNTMCKIEFSKLLSEGVKSVNKFFVQKSKINDSFLAHYKKSLANNDHLGIASCADLFVNGNMVPKSNAESFRHYNISSMLGSATAQYNMSKIFLHGKYFMKNLKLAFVFSKSSAKRGCSKAVFNTSVYLKNEIGNNKDLYRAFHLLNKIKDFSTDSQKISELSSRREKSYIFRTIFASLIKGRENKFLKPFVGSIFTTNLLSFSIGILDKCNSVSSSLKFSNNYLTKGSMQSIIKIADLFLENRQDYIAIQKFKSFPGLKNCVYSHFSLSTSAEYYYKNDPKFSKRLLENTPLSLTNLFTYCIYWAEIIKRNLTSFCIYFISFKIFEAAFILLLFFYYKFINY